jgi:hypothetical protein
MITLMFGLAIPTSILLLAMITPTQVHLIDDTQCTVHSHRRRATFFISTCNRSI